MEVKNGQEYNSKSRCAEAHQGCEHSGKHILRYIGIESMCNAHGIDPIGMAVILCTEDGCTVVYDDSTISKSENRAKQRAVEKVIAALV